MNQYIEVDGKLYHYITSINDIIELKYLFNNYWLVYKNIEHDLNITRYISRDAKVIIKILNHTIEFKNGIYIIDDIKSTHQPNMKMIIKTNIVDENFELLITQ